MNDKSVDPAIGLAEHWKDCEHSAPADVTAALAKAVIRISAALTAHLASQPDCVVVPGEMQVMSITDPDYDSHHDAYQQGWNACRNAMLRAAKETTK